MKTSEKLLTNNSVGLWTMVKDLEQDLYALFTTKDGNGEIRCSGWHDSTQEAIYYAGALPGHSESYIDSMNLQIIRTIHPSELMGPGYEIGQKVRIKPNAKEECEKYNLGWPEAKARMAEEGWGSAGRYVCIATLDLQNKEKSDYFTFPFTALEPYFEDETGVTEIAGIKYRKADIEALVKSAKDLKPLE